MKRKSFELFYKTLNLDFHDESCYSDATVLVAIGLVESAIPLNHLYVLKQLLKRVFVGLLFLFGLFPCCFVFFSSSVQVLVYHLV